MVYGIRMRFDKLIHQRDAVVSTGHNSSVILNVFAGRFSVVADYHLAGNAASVVRVVIGKVIQRKNECFLALRQVNVPFLVMNGSVIIYGLFTRSLIETMTYPLSYICWVIALNSSTVVIHWQKPAVCALS